MQSKYGTIRITKIIIIVIQCIIKHFLKDNCTKNGQYFSKVNNKKWIDFLIKYFSCKYDTIYKQILSIKQKL